MANNNSDFGAFMSGLIVGGLIGAVAALLMAPQSGEETRSQIRSSAIDLSSRAQDELSNIQIQAERKLEEIRAQAEELQANAQRSIDEARAQITSTLKRGDDGEEAEA